MWREKVIRKQYYFNRRLILLSTLKETVLQEYRLFSYFSPVVACKTPGMVFPLEANGDRLFQLIPRLS